MAEFSEEMLPIGLSIKPLIMEMERKRMLEYIGKMKLCKLQKHHSIGCIIHHLTGLNHQLSTWTNHQSTRS